VGIQGFQSGSKALYIVAAFVLQLLSLAMVGLAIWSVTGEVWIGRPFLAQLLDSVGLIIIAFAVFDVAKFLLEEQVLARSGVEQNRGSRTRKTTRTKPAWSGVDLGERLFRCPSATDTFAGNIAILLLQQCADYRGLGYDLAYTLGFVTRRGAGHAYFLYVTSPRRQGLLLAAGLRGSRCRPGKPHALRA
jgi:hypothetical protein